MAQIEVLSGGVVTLERDPDLTRVPDDRTLALLEKVRSRSDLDPDRLPEIERAIGATSIRAAELRERLATTPPIPMEASLISVHGICSSLFRIYEERHRTTGGDTRSSYDRSTGQLVVKKVPRRRQKYLEPVDYRKGYELLVVSRAAAITAISRARGSFWPRELQRLIEAMAVQDKRVRDSWRSASLPGTDIEQVLSGCTLGALTQLYFDPTYGPFRIDPRSRQNNGARYVKPRPSHPRPLDLTWLMSYHPDRRVEDFTSAERQQTTLTVPGAGLARRPVSPGQAGLGI